MLRFPSHLVKRGCFSWPCRLEEEWKQCQGWFPSEPSRVCPYRSVCIPRRKLDDVSLRIRPETTVRFTMSQSMILEVFWLIHMMPDNNNLPVGCQGPEWRGVVSRGYWCCLIAKSCPILCDPMDWSLPGCSVYGISQTRVLEWVVIFFSRGSSRPRDWIRTSCIADRLFTTEPARGSPIQGT